MDKNNIPINIDNRIIHDVVTNAKNTLAKVNRGAKLIFPDILKIYSSLLVILDNENAADEAAAANENSDNTI